MVSFKSVVMNVKFGNTDYGVVTVYIRTRSHILVPCKNINTSKHRHCSESRKRILADPIKPSFQPLLPPS